MNGSAYADLQGARPAVGRGIWDYAWGRGVGPSAIWIHDCGHATLLKLGDYVDGGVAARIRAWLAANFTFSA